MSDKAPIIKVDGTVGRGEILGVLGASGSGKSTLLRAIAGFVAPTEGHIFIHSKRVCGHGNVVVPAEDRNVGLMFQDYALFPHMSVADNIMYGIHRLPDRVQRVTDLLELVELSGFQDRSPNSLSGGQKQRVALARALAPKPVALLLDEPFANLDGPMRHEMGHTIRRILREEGIGAILVTHDRSEAFALSDRLAILGCSTKDSAVASITQTGPPQDIFLNPNNTEVARLTGAMIVVNVNAEDGRAPSAFGELVCQSDACGEGHAIIRRHQWVFRDSPSGDYQVLEHQYVGPGIKLCVRGPAGDVWLDHPDPWLELGTTGVLTVLGPVFFTTH
jgi:iron(III) transport system ATP-binding protein